MRRIKARVQYDGTAYSGFQRQKNAVSVQETLEKCIASCLGHEVKVKASGRTDAGVHARGQVISFTTAAPVPAARLPAALSGVLPEDIVMDFAREVPLDFDPVRDAVERTYCYRVWRGARRDFMMSRYSYHYGGKLDFEVMQKESEAIVGKYDFAGFRAKGSQSGPTVREVYRAEWIRKDHMGRSGLLWEFWISGDGFLYKMVRLLAGTMVDAGRGRFSPGRTSLVLESSGRVRPGTCLPGRGLCLEEVRFS